MHVECAIDPARLSEATLGGRVSQVFHCMSDGRYTVVRVGGSEPEGSSDWTERELRGPCFPGGHPLEPPRSGSEGSSRA
jgi:hypothetical protein